MERSSERVRTHSQLLLQIVYSPTLIWKRCSAVGKTLAGTSLLSSSSGSFLSLSLSLYFPRPFSETREGDRVNTEREKQSGLSLSKKRGFTGRARGEKLWTGPEKYLRDEE